MLFDKDIYLKIFKNPINKINNNLKKLQDGKNLDTFLNRYTNDYTIAIAIYLKFMAYQRYISRIVHTDL